MKKKLLTGLVMGILIFEFAGMSEASLWVRGGGLIYDDVLNVTWLQDANYAATSGYSSNGCMNWQQAKNWASQLEYYDSVRDTTWSNWRLPSVSPINGTSFMWYPNGTTVTEYNGAKDHGYNLSAPGSAYEGSTGSELAYMYYNNLLQIAKYDVNGNKQEEYGLQDTGPFINLNGEWNYWTSNPDPVPGNATVFHMPTGWQTNLPTDMIGPIGTWVVMDGDVAPGEGYLWNPNPVPIPGAVWLLASCFLGVKGIQRTRRG